jgi:hypothetical protein
MISYGKRGELYLGFPLQSLPLRYLPSLFVVRLLIL